MTTQVKSALALAGFLALTYLVAATSTIFTVSAIPTWYAALAKPPFNPPNAIFGPVWTLLYTLMAIAAWFIWRLPPSPLRRDALILFAVQLTLNFLWSFIFFGSHRIGLALAEIALLWLTILVTTIAFFRLNPPAGWLFVPYLAWVTFAAILNAALYRLN
jgi:tryptophan-rich sensory protein